MSVKQKNRIFDLPLKIIFTEEGINYFLKNNKKLNRFRMADNSDAYGILLNKFTPSSIQQMMLIDYISRMEVSSSEFLTQRQTMLDFSKLIIYGVLYRKFDSVVFSKLLNSNLIISWNRANPGSIIDENTRINETFLKNVLSTKKSELQVIKSEILTPIQNSITSDDKLLPDEKNIQFLLSEKYLDKLRLLIWFILSRGQGTADYTYLINDIRHILSEYLEKARISEYFSLMLLELISKAENTNLLTYGRRLIRKDINIDEILQDESTRQKIIRNLDENEESIFINWKIRSRSAAVGGEHYIEVTIYNQESEFNEVKNSINNQKNLVINQKSLLDFYSDIPESNTNTELGLYYLSYLNEACRNLRIKFESNVHQLVSSERTVVTIKLNF